MADDVLADRRLPAGVGLVRTTDTFTDESVPAGLRRAHRVAAGVWGRLVVLAGAVTYVEEGSGLDRTLGPGDAQVIAPDTAHHVEPAAGARFHVEFHR